MYKRQVYNVQVIASDGTHQTTQDITVNITPVNESSPVFTSPTDHTFAENSAVSITVVADDADLPDEVITYSLAPGFGDNAQFTISSSTGQLTLNSVPDFENPLDLDGDNVYNVQVIASDGTNETRQDITVNITPVNDNLHTIVTPTELEADENQTFVATIETADDDDPQDALEFSVISGMGDDTFFDIDQNTGELSFISPPNFEMRADANGDNVYEVVVAATDSDGQTVMRNFRITVLNVNEQPVDLVGLANVQIGENSDDGFVVGSVVGTDPDINDSLTYSLADDAGGRFVIDPDTGEVRVATDADLNFEDIPTHTITVEVEDAGGLTYDEEFVIELFDENDPPVAVDFTVTVPEGGTFTLDSTDLDLIVDEDNDILTGSIIVEPTNGRVDLGVNGLTYVHNGGETTKDSFQYLVDDGNGGTDIGIVTITVSPVNDAPVATAETIEGEPLQTIIERGELLQNDLDVDNRNSELQIVIVERPATGDLIELSDGSLLFIPGDDSPSIESFTYRLFDGQAFSNIVRSEIAIPSGPGSGGNSGTTIPADEPDQPEEQPDDDLDGMGPLNENQTNDSDNTEGSEQLGPADQTNPSNGLANTAPTEFTDDNFVVDTDSLSSDLFSTNYGFVNQRSSINLSDILGESVQQVKTVVSSSDPFGTSTFIASIMNDVGRVNEELIENISSETGTVVAAAGITGIATAVYVIWMARGGVLLASVVSSVPAWQSFDPLPILQYAAENEDPDSEDESIESMLQQPTA